MSEDFYDKELAPRLREISKLCKDKNLPFFGQVEFEPGRFGFDGYTGNSDNNFAFRMLWHAAMAAGNVEKLIISLIADGQRFGHTSPLLEALKKIIKELLG